MNQHLDYLCMGAGNKAGDSDYVAECPVPSACIAPGIAAAYLDVMYFKLVLAGILQKSVECSSFHVIFDIKIQIPGSFPESDIEF